jgi:hypothetical protein
MSAQTYVKVSVSLDEDTIRRLARCKRGHYKGGTTSPAILSRPPAYAPCFMRNAAHALRCFAPVEVTSIHEERGRIRKQE